jgi:hypothetical protein
LIDIRKVEEGLGALFHELYSVDTQIEHARLLGF